MTAAIAPGARVAVIGAGIVGLSAAVHLARRGRPLLLLDAAGPGEGASFGNGGLISVDACIPVALPGMLRNVPRWLTQPDGPLSVPPAYAPRALPWLIRWIAAGRNLDLVRRSSAAMRALHRDAFDRYRELLGNEMFRDLFRQSGLVQVWSTAGVSRAEEVARDLNREAGVETQDLGPDDLRQMFPGISGAVRGLLFPRNGHTVSPARITAALAATLAAEGGVFRRERVLKIIPREGGGWTLMTNLANHDAEAVVVAAGSWSGRLVAPLGVALPLETERGYHLELAGPSVELRMPIIDKTRSFCLTPMAEGLRLAGTVEIAGLEAPPNERRAAALRRGAEALFPGLTGGAQRMWMGFRPTLPDSVPAIGPVSGHPGLMMAVGHGHTGMIGGPATGRLVAEMLTGERPHIPPEPYGMHRFARA